VFRIDAEVRMTRQRARLWFVVASLFTLANIGGAAMAAVGAEVLHMAAHIGLVLLGAYFVLRLGPRARGQEVLAEEKADPRLERLQQSLDAIGIEVERIGEAQRFTAKVVAERAGVTSPKPPREPGT
jgi:hypothetical protein